MYDYLVVGSGLFGSVFAHEMKKAGKKVLVIEKRNHIGGNCYSKNIEGINVCLYGPHVFHTSNKKIWDYINQFAQFNHFVNRVKLKYGDKLYSMPINLMTFYQIAGCTTPAEAKKYLAENTKQIDSPKNLEEWIVSQVGWGMYNMLVRGYTKKQWGRDPKELPASIIRRLPIRLNFDDNYYNDCYQGFPVGGYTPIFEKLLDGVEVKLGECDYHNWENYARKLVYTGKIDELFKYEYGELEYRSLDFKHRLIDTQDFQGNAQVNYGEESVPYTRTVEHKHFEFGTQTKTIVTYEYPADWTRNKIPYYPVNGEKNNKIYEKYKKKTYGTNIIVAGRLGNYKYFDMDATIASALHVVEKEKA